MFLLDARSDTQHFAFKGTSAPPGGVAPSPGHVYSLHASKATLNVHKWGAEQPHIRCALQEKGSAVAASADGQFVAVGTHSGKVMLWLAATGELVRLWEAQFRKVTALEFSCDCTFLYSCGEDGILSCWLLSSLLSSPACTHAPPPKPFFRSSHHSLPITALCCSALPGATALVVSASLDHTVRVFSPVAQQQLQCYNVAATWPTCLALARLHTHIFAGGGNGNIIQLPLFCNQSDAHAPPLDHETLKAHKTSVCALALSGDDAVLVSGGEDGTVCVWDALSMQLTRTLQLHKQPISSLHILPQEFPADRQVAQLKKFAPAQSDTGAGVVLSAAAPSGVVPVLLGALQVGPDPGALPLLTDSFALSAYTDTLEVDNKKLREHNKKMAKLGMDAIDSIPGL